MEFDKSKVYYEPEPWMIGKRVYFADSISELKKAVTDEYVYNQGFVVEDATESYPGYPFAVRAGYYLSDQGDVIHHYTFIYYDGAMQPKELNVYYDKVLERLVADVIIPASGRIYYKAVSYEDAAEWIGRHKMFEPVMRAYEDGKSIQCRLKGGDKWIPATTPSWNEANEYRIVPYAVNRMKERIYGLLVAADILPAYYADDPDYAEIRMFVQGIADYLYNMNDADEEG